MPWTLTRLVSLMGFQIHMIWGRGFHASSTRVRHRSPGHHAPQLLDNQRSPRLVAPPPAGKGPKTLIGARPSPWPWALAATLARITEALIQSRKAHLQTAVTALVVVSDQILGTAP
eukprot:scaffold3132_cov60-Phaeocystis_antarctica.AAC.3